MTTLLLNEHGPKRKYWHEFIKNTTKDIRESKDLPYDIGFSMEIIGVNSLSISFSTDCSECNGKNTYDAIMEFVSRYESEELVFLLDRLDYKDNPDYEVVVSGSFRIEKKEEPK